MARLCEEFSIKMIDEKLFQGIDAGGRGLSPCRPTEAQAMPSLWGLALNAARAIATLREHGGRHNPPFLGSTPSRNSFSAAIAREACRPQPPASPQVGRAYPGGRRRPRR